MLEQNSESSDDDITACRGATWWCPPDPLSLYPFVLMPFVSNFEIGSTNFSTLSSGAHGARALSQDSNPDKIMNRVSVVSRMRDNNGERKKSLVMIISSCSLH